MGTILGVGAFVATTGLAETARAQVSSRFDALKATEVRVFDSSPDGSSPYIDDIDRRLGSLNGVNSAGLFYPVDRFEQLQVRNSPSKWRVGEAIPVVAITPGGLRAHLPQLSEGRTYNELHQSRAERVAIVGRIAASKLGINRLDRLPAVFIDDRAYSVIGILEEVERNSELLLSVMIPTSSEARDFGSQSPDFQVIIDTQQGAASLVGSQAALALRPHDPDRLQVVVPPDPQSLRNSVEADVTGLYYALSALALAIGAVAIANAMLLNTIERRSEIGLRRALGAQRSHIVRQVVIEAAMVGGIAGCSGAAVGVYAIAGVSFARGWTATLDPMALIVAPALGTLTGAVAGIAPALRAAKTPPAVTLRST